MQVASGRKRGGKSIVTKLNGIGEQEEIGKGNEDNGLFQIVFTRPKSK